MITNISFRIEKGQVYADITRNTIIEGEKIYIGEAAHPKYLPSQGLSVVINITPYLDSEIKGNIQNLWRGMNSGDVGFYNQKELSIKPTIQTDEGRIYQPYYDVYWRDAQSSEPFGLLTRLPYIQRVVGENVIICAQCADDDRNSISIGDAKSAEFNILDYGVVAISITANNGNAIVLNTVAGDNYDYNTIIPLRTISKGLNTRRLLWRNELGGIDSWYFEFLRENNYATTSEVFYSATDGYTRTNRKSERLHTVETRELDDITAEVVSYILASPEVYLVEDDDLEPIDIVTEECRTYSDTELSRVQVSYRKRKRE